MLLNPVQSQSIIRCALEHQFALLAVNADSHACVTDCLEAARLVDAPIIIETSLWQLTGHSYGSGDPWLGMTRYLADLDVLANSARYAKVPVIFHTDHIKGPDTLPLLSDAIRGFANRSPLLLKSQTYKNGFRLSEEDGSDKVLRPSTISLDSSELTEEQNREHLIALARVSREAGVDLTLEAEAGVDTGVTDLLVTERLLGGVERSEPGVIFLWAPGVGTQHGFSSEGYPTFSLEAIRNHQKRASQICGRAIGIALHGSSGLPEESLRAAVGQGVAKVNWSSESLLIRAQAARGYYQEFGEQLEKSHRRFKSTAMDHGLQSYISNLYLPKVQERLDILNAAGAGELCRLALDSI